jgi:choline dehydrogenase
VSEPTFDYIIVGAGTAGALIANRLSADANSRVLLIEAGPRDRYHWIHIPVGYLYCIGNPRTDWLYSTEPEAGLNGRALRYPRGKTLGGCSSINGMIYMRGQSRDYDQWARLTGDDTWTWDNVLPAFKQHEDHHGGADSGDPRYAEFHGVGGEWRVEKQRLRWDILDAFALAAQQAGVPATCDFNRGSNEGVGLLRRQPERWLALEHREGFFAAKPATDGPTFELWTNAQVARINRRGHLPTAARGVRARRYGTAASW